MVFSRTRLVPFVLLLACATAQDAAPEIHGRIEDLGSGLKLLRTWGTPAERGYAHGFLLAKQVAAVGIAEFGARFGRGSGKAILEVARSSVDRLIEYPDDVQQELEGLFRGLRASGVDRRIEALDRDFDFTDLKVANALDVFGLMGCSGVTVWGERAAGGGVLTGRNFDWPLTGKHMLDGTVLLVQHLPNGRATASVTWPGYVPIVTGISRAGVATFLHVGSAKVTLTPEPDSWPTAVAARSILEGVGADATAEAAFELAADRLSWTSPPAGFLTRVVLPRVPAKGPPVAVFETDSKSAVQGGAITDYSVVTNHFCVRQDGRSAGRDSTGRAKQLEQGLDRCLTDGDKVVSPAEIWNVLSMVERGGGRRFGTLHSLVFRNDPWCFELRIGTLDGNGRIVAATASERRFELTREQIFGAEDALPGGSR